MRQTDNSSGLINYILDILWGCVDGQFLYNYNYYVNSAATQIKQKHRRTFYYYQTHTNTLQSTRTASQSVSQSVITSNPRTDRLIYNKLTTTDTDDDDDDEDRQVFL